MPRGNGTGPMGMGAMTGQGKGYCNGFTATEYSHRVVCSRGYGCGFGRGRGYRGKFNTSGVLGNVCYGSPINTGANQAYDEKSFLNDQAAFLENQLLQVKKRLSSLNEELK